ncbi:hypothetical protein MLD38_028950 [Melastoma candidum]|uniref:Uncharacterized protein n=1 Tax=Melastoma candidum TaxID=119954 RepID=A0ACB9N3E5_9MYRT|nr:hypothetical protein MLD38_028950 [Melastoma candidum]
MLCGGGVGFEIPFAREKPTSGHSITGLFFVLQASFGYTGAVVGDREALIAGLPSLSISLNWKKETSQENDFKDAVSVGLPLIDSAIEDIEKGIFPQSCALKGEIPTSPQQTRVSKY